MILPWLVVSWPDRRTRTQIDEDPIEIGFTATVHHIQPCLADSFSRNTSITRRQLGAQNRLLIWEGEEREKMWT